MEEKKFFEKTKVKMALAFAVTEFILVFATSLMEQNGMPMSPEVKVWAQGGLLAIFLSLLGGHTISDTIATSAKIKASSTSRDLITEIAKEVVAKTPGKSPRK